MRWLCVSIVDCSQSDGDDCIADGCCGRALDYSWLLSVHFCCVCNPDCWNEIEKDWPKERRHCEHLDCYCWCCDCDCGCYWWADRQNLHAACFECDSFRLQKEDKRRHTGEEAVKTHTESVTSLSMNFGRFWLVLINPTTDRRTRRLSLNTHTFCRKKISKRQFLKTLSFGWCGPGIVAVCSKTKNPRS